MADYWKSQAKKFCDFCKCWIADNKPSIEFHEKGKRHKESVSQRLSDISKKSRKEYQNMLQVDEDMKKMEKAALKAYMKDVEANADFTSQVIKEQLAERQKQAAEKELEESAEVKKKSANSETNVDTKEDESKIKPEVAKKMWYEAESEQGYTYYWHIETGESIWEPPEESYVSMTEQKEGEGKEKKRKAKEEQLAQKKEKEEKKQKAEEERARLEREKMRSRRVTEEKPSEPVVAAFVGPAPKPDPYGGWKTVESRVNEPIDLQLPAQEFIEIKIPSIMEPKVKFKEKIVTTLGVEDEAGSSFKKRKFNSNPKRNMRQRLDDD